MATETSDALPTQALNAEPERLAYSIHEAANLLGVDYFSVYRETVGMSTPLSMRSRSSRPQLPPSTPLSETL
jgi:hypothetical protein